MDKVLTAPDKHRHNKDLLARPITQQVINATPAQIKTYIDNNWSAAFSRELVTWLVISMAYVIRFVINKNGDTGAKR